MNKKAYIKPELMVEELATEPLMLTASAGYGVDTTSGDFTQRGDGRRGSWGNLWDEGE
ncbi:MAG: hypothetical protein IJE15_00130 [Bacteroidaceae bacterium]|nr:hypothetical protein [Bacteroidaceae bacterium]